MPFPAGTAGSPTTAHRSTLLSSDRFFYARFRVCESDTAGRLTDPRQSFCLRYPGGKLKPVGNPQKYSDRPRVAAFGYLMDHGNTRYGGVLRAPMKFVGPKSYDAAGRQQPGNSRIEWDEFTGVFHANPDHHVEGKSGVVNYLNQFGRTGPTPGIYKSHDPVTELYYEALRYVQGLPPTPQATAGMTDAHKDGFPVYEHWDDPHAGGSAKKDYSCVRNNILLIGDVNTHNDKSIPGNTGRLDAHEFARPANPGGNEPDFVAWTKVVGGFESGAQVPFPDSSTLTTSNPNPASGSPRSPLPALANIANADSAGAGKASFYVAGMAYWANTRDIRETQWTEEPSKQRPGMRVTTYVLDVNERGANSNFETRRTRQFFLAAKYGGFRDKSGFGNPFLNDKGALDNSAWEDDADSGDARNYYLSSSAKAVLRGLDDIFANLAAQNSNIAADDVPTARLTPGKGAHRCQASFDAEGWSGDIQALPIALDAEGNIKAGSVKADASWSAADVLDAATLDTDARKIFVGRVDATARTADVFQCNSLEDAPATA